MIIRVATDVLALVFFVGGGFYFRFASRKMDEATARLKEANTSLAKAIHEREEAHRVLHHVRFGREVSS